MSEQPDMGEEIHDLVHAFADGELEPAEADAFRVHLGTCEQCQAELNDILQLQALSGRLASTQTQASSASAPPAQELRPSQASRPAEEASSRAFRPAWSRRRRTALTLVLGGSLAAAFALAVLREPGPGAGKPEALALAPTRSLEARLSYGGASTWRPYNVKRSGTERALEMVPLEKLAKLEKAGDYHGMGASYLLRGEREQAAEFLTRAAASVDVDSDRAVLAFSKGSLNEALQLLEGVLEKAPNHAPALWNRGLVLRELGLDLLAAESFGKVVALNEAGWSDEARERKVALENPVLERRNRWKAARDAGKALVEQGTPMPESAVRDAPPVARRSLYLAVGSAPTAERVLALRPVAQALDAHYGARVLEPSLERIAKRDFTKRAPLAATFAQLVAGKLEASEGEGFLRQLQASGENDLLLSALPLLQQLPARWELYASAAREEGDPWFLMDVERQHALAQRAASEPAKAEATLRSALTTCEQQRLDARCAELHQLLAELYAAERRWPEAREHTQRALAWARQVNDVELESGLLRTLGQLAGLQGASALERAYLQEAQLRQPG
ncbi:zf-HC2 domain-containing protein [Hyalangium rubrum]|uniref:Zf-HC2 domain-containing protein n=1 Tax=Hyalangium rubrum TaxID=3103134 RepID=A0ABU5GXJ5_9BACT|nr:zf-HC2 domain-containing protein [Hyalangium sp. s54d21]MDY7225905.1 zf-HC2 domain-containing protein [Hyalangium sp. s54d21]